MEIASYREDWEENNSKIDKREIYVEQFPKLIAQKIRNSMPNLHNMKKIFLTHTYLIKSNNRCRSLM